MGDTIINHFMETNLTVPQVLPLALDRKYSPTWHIVLEDGNITAGSIRFCMKDANEEEKRFGELLLSLSKTQRRKIYKTLWN